MEFAPVLVKRIFPSLERYEPETLDSSALTTYKICPRMYFFEYVLAFKSKVTEPYFSWGTAYHKFHEIVEQSFLNGGDGDFKNALLTASDIFSKDWPRGGEGKWEFMTVTRLQQSCFIAWERILATRAQGRLRVIETERPFNLEIIPNTNLFHSGRLDKVVKQNGKPWVLDIKTTSKELKWWARGIDPNDQFIRYTHAARQLTGEPVQGVLIEVLYNSKDLANGTRKGPTIEQFNVTYSQWQIDDWLRDEMMWRSQLDKSREVDVWPKNEKACGFCKFHSVCKAPSEYGQQSQLKTNFVQRPWDNTGHDEA
jgi:hypothetical protein